MFLAGIHVVVICWLLQGTLCLDPETDIMSTNITAEAMGILECFSLTVDVPWQFSDEEYPRVLFFERVTVRLCDRNVWRIFECNYPLMKRFHNVQKLHKSYATEEQTFYKTEQLEHFENGLKQKRQAIHALDKLILFIENLKQLAYARNETRILNDNCSKTFLDIDKLKNYSIRFVAEYAQLQTEFELFRIRSNTMGYYLPAFIIIIFICGMAGNGMLLFIFLRHPETREGPNAMLVNLAISDTLFLFFNVALDYCHLFWGFPLGVTGCYFYTFFLTVPVGGCVYSMVLLSLSRYLAVTAKPGNRSSKFLSSTQVMLALVWIMSSIISIPDALSVKATEHRCIADGANHLLKHLCNFFLLSLLPLISITCSYILASRRLIDSARNMPGEAVGHIKVKRARERGAKILPALAFLFAITYLPYYTLWAINAVLNIDTTTSPVVHHLYYTVYFLFNLNSALNPIALYAASGMFRKYFNMYVCLGFVKKQTPAERQNNI